MTEEEEPTSFTDEELAAFLESSSLQDAEQDFDEVFITAVVSLYLWTRGDVEKRGKGIRITREQSHEVAFAVMKTYLDARDPDDLWDVEYPDTDDSDD